MKNNMKIFAATALSLAIAASPAYAQTAETVFSNSRTSSFIDSNGDGVITAADGNQTFTAYNAWLASIQSFLSSRTVLAVSQEQMAFANPTAPGDNPKQNQRISFTHTSFYTETPPPANAPPPPIAHSDTKTFIDVNDDRKITIDDFIDGRADSAQLDRLDEWRTFTSQNSVERDGLTVTLFRVISIPSFNLQMEKAVNVSRYYVYSDTASSPSASSGGGGGSSGVGIAVGAAAVVGVVVYALSGASDIPETTSFFPLAKYAYDNGLRRYQVGGRFDWQKGDWSAHWTATKTSAAGASFSFGSGMQWQGDIFAAKFNSNGVSKRSDSHFSLSAEKEFGLWSFAPLYRVDYAKDETAEIWRHSVSLKAVWQADKWTLINSAGFHGESLAAFGDNASAKILLWREF